MELILILIILSITKNNIIDPQNIKIDNDFTNNNILKKFNKSKDKISYFNELFHYVEEMNQEEIEWILKESISDIKKKKFLSLIDEILFLLNNVKIYNYLNNSKKLDEGIHKINKIKNLLENKISHTDESKNNENNLKNDSYIKEENEENENIKDCVEYGLSPNDENYIVCTKYE